MQTITYKAKSQTRHDVFLDGKHVGQIVYSSLAGGWVYQPKGSKVSGETFSRLAECKASLEAH